MSEIAIVIYFLPSARRHSIPFRLFFFGGSLAEQENLPVSLSNDGKLIKYAHRHCHDPYAGIYSHPFRFISNFIPEIFEHGYDVKQHSKYPPGHVIVTFTAKKSTVYVGLSSTACAPPFVDRDIQASNANTFGVAESNIQPDGK